MKVFIKLPQCSGLMFVAVHFLICSHVKHGASQIESFVLWPLGFYLQTDPVLIEETGVLLILFFLCSGNCVLGQPLCRWVSIKGLISDPVDQRWVMPHHFHQGQRRQGQLRAPIFFLMPSFKQCHCLSTAMKLCLWRLCKLKYHFRQQMFMVHF